MSEYGANNTDENLMKKCRLGMVIIDGIDSLVNSLVIIYLDLIFDARKVIFGVSVHNH